MTTFERVRKTLVHALRVDEAEVTPQAALTEDLGADSLDAVEVLMALEEEFDIQISDSDAENLTTVQQIVDYVDQKTKPRSRDYLALGDSISIDTYTGVAGGGAASQFARLIEAEHFENLTADGLTTAGALDSLHEVTIHPTLVTVTTGGNDFLLAASDFAAHRSNGSEEDPSASWEEIARVPLENLRTLAAHLATYHCPVILNTVYDPSDGDDSAASELGLPPEARRAFDALNTGIREIARQRQFLLSDLEILFKGHGLGSQETWFVNQIEPNYAGATAIANHWHDLYRCLQE